MARQGKKIPDSVWVKFLELLSEQTTSVAGTCRVLGISPHSYYNKRSTDFAFGIQVDNVMDSIRRPFAEDALFTLIAAKDLGAIKFFLSQRGGRRWNDSKMIPFFIQDEIKKQEQGKQLKQGLPSLEAMVCAEAYQQGKELDIDNIPDTIVVSLADIKETLSNPFYKKRMMEDNPREGETEYDNE